MSEHYPDAPAEGHTDTSYRAAQAIAPAHGRLQRMALFAIQEVGSAGLTAEELAGRLGLPREAIQPRTSELRLKGLIRDSGQRRRNRSGLRAIVWTAAAPGGAA